MYLTEKGNYKEEQLCKKEAKENFDFSKNIDINPYKYLCIVLISSFCGILQDFGMKVEDDEKLLITAINTGDISTVIQYTTLMHSKLSSNILLNRISTTRNSSSYSIDSKMQDMDETVKTMNEMDTDEYTEMNKSLQSNAHQIYSSFETIISTEVNTSNLVIAPTNKKFSVPPLRIERVGPGSWNRAQLPEEYPED
ncbi:uncharacterized protein CMU_005450 [Cryptosporidium muris RN66]|uniref:Uncharacterized protein n=1 Tax=Cryptosporidium muris (strain RN66) TaxID=441375 RepID=B6AHC7_CRYMR|nr:uncharacterized protein CMU_005450 [Cryptosporidium muris RN66]EEA07622.1 hypothetical protein, conserved [Cryptosporidium muris RN66]|eukprot:XP_002141971.1 hypothetical protein [Cryptosporidium muris RN66]